MEELNEERPKELNAIQRRILGVLMEKARTTPDSYPLTLNGIVTAANQKSNRYPKMNLESERVEDELAQMRQAGLIAEVFGNGRVAKYRHHAYTVFDVKGKDAAILTELLLRGEQTLGDLRSRASRIDAIDDMATLQELVSGLVDRGLIVTLTPAGRGQMVTHNLYEDWELDGIKKRVAGAGSVAAEVPQRNEPSGGPLAASAAEPLASTERQSMQKQIDLLQEQVEELTLVVEQISDRLAKLEG